MFQGLVHHAAASKAVMTEGLAQQQYKQHRWLSSATNSMLLLFILSHPFLFAVGGSMSPKGLVDNLAASEAGMTDALAAATQAA